MIGEIASGCGQRVGLEPAFRFPLSAFKKPLFPTAPNKIKKGKYY
jgi:hypothetical protein